MACHLPTLREARVGLARAFDGQMVLIGDAKQAMSAGISGPVETGLTGRAALSRRDGAFEELLLTFWVASHPTAFGA